MRPTVPSYGDGVILDSPRIDPARLTDETGWSCKPEGLCRGEICVPAPGAALADGTLDATVVAAALGMPLVEDTAHGVWALGPATLSGHALTTAEAADPELVTRDGQPFRLSSLRGTKVVLVAWSSY
jgi:hypothetical protein